MDAVNQNFARRIRNFKIPKLFSPVAPIFRFVAAQKKKIILSIVVGLVYAAVNAGFFYYMKPFLSSLLEMDGQIRQFALYILIFYGIKSILNYASEYMAISAIQDTIAAARMRFLQNFFSMQSTERISGKILSKCFEDINQMCGAVKLFTATLIKDSFTLVALVIVLFLIAPKLALIVALIYITTAIPTYFFGRKTKVRTHALRENNESLVGNLAEFFKHKDAIQNARAIAFILEKISPSVRLDAERQKRLSQIDRGAPLLIEFTAVLALSVALLLYGTAALSELTLDSAVIFSLASLSLYTPIKNLGAFHIGLQRALASAERIEPFLVAPEMDFRNGYFSQRILIDIKNCVYSDGVTALQEISLKIQKGETLAITGANGAGKTTLLKCIAGLQPFQGNIMFDNQFESNANRNSTLPWILYASHIPAIFNMSLRDNLSLGRTFDDANLRRVLGSVGLVPRLRENKTTIDSLLGEGGEVLSHGMQQRLILARIILYQPCVVLLDEAFNSIDKKEAPGLLELLRSELAQSTLIISTHSQVLLKKMDRVIHLANGQISGLGAHNELLSAYPKNLAVIQ